MIGIIASPFIYLLSLCFFKSKRIWCFGAWFGMRYADNSKYLFEHVINNSTKNKIAAVWIAGNKKLAKEIREKGYQAYSKYSFKGLWYQLVSKVFVCTVNSKDFYFATLTRRNIIVQLWHGAPLKKIGYDAEQSKFHKAVTRARSYFIDNYSWIVSPSQTFDAMFCSAFDIKPEKILRAGYPRNDGLFVSHEDKIKIRQQFGVTDQKQMLLYLPTHRGEGKYSDSVNKIINQFITLHQRMEEQNLVVLIKPHYYDLKGGWKGWNLNSVKVIENFGKWDLYQVLGASDGLITDYSSVFLDYEIIQKPVYFLAPDLHWYVSEDRGMYFPYSSFAGKYCETVESLIIYLTKREGHLSCNFNINEDKDGEYSRKLFEKLLSAI